MRMNKLTLVFTLITLCLFENIRAQDNVGIKFFGLSIHPKGEKENTFLMPHKLDKNGYLVMNLGAEVMYEHFFYQDLLSVKVIQALYADCAARTGGFSHIGVRAKIFKTSRHSLYGGIGPTLVYRRNWLEMEGYVNLNRFKGGENVKWQYLFIAYGGEFEYKYTLTHRIDLSASFVPGYPDLMSLAVGINYKLETKTLKNP